MELPFVLGCVYSPVWRQDRGREGGGREREREDANKPEPGVFVSERVSTDVNSVPL